MTRDMELVREILIALEVSDKFEVPTEEVSRALPDVEERTMIWHLGLMEQAGLLTSKTTLIADFDFEDSTIDSVRISWSGYEFLAAAVNDTVWQSAKRQAGDMFRSLSIGTLQALLQATVSKAVGL